MNLKEEYLAFWYTHPVAFVGRYAAWAMCGGLKILALYSLFAGLIELWIVRLQAIPNYFFWQGVLQGFLSGMPMVVILSGLVGAATALVVKPWEDLWLFDEEDECCGEGCDKEGCCKEEGMMVEEAVMTAPEPVAAPVSSETQNF